jgi:hypothetical protein
MEKYLEIIKRFWPKFYNRITWTVVVAGLALISSPLWEQLVTALILKTFDLSNYIPDEPVYGIALVALGLIYHLGASMVEVLGSRATNPKLKAAQVHDKALTQKFFEIATEDEVIYCLEMLGSDHSCDDEQLKVLLGIVRFGDLAENEFLTVNVQEQFGRLHSDVKQLTNYIAMHFFSMHNASQTYLYPDLNVDRQGSGSREECAKYNRYASQLIALVRSANENYRSFRRTLKTELAI